MAEAGWCPSDIERAKGKVLRTQTLYFLSRMSKDEIHRTHRTCTPTLCSSFQLDLATYESKHRQPSCKCPDAAPSMDDVMMVLRNGELPLLQMTKTGGDSGSVQIEVVPCTPEISYVAISHLG